MHGDGGSDHRPSSKDETHRISHVDFPIVLCLLIILVFYTSVAGEAPSIFRDDFDTPTDDWAIWVQRTGSTTIQDGICCLEIKDEATGQHDNVAALCDYYLDVEDLEMPWLHNGMEVRLRCSDDNRQNSPIGGGIRFWGFANLVPFQIPPENALYFWSGSPECAEGTRGLSAMTTVDSDTVHTKPIENIDITQWHTYTILWGKDNATYMVDGEIVATADQVPSKPMGTVILISNMVTGEEAGAIDLEGDQRMEIDYVHLFYSDEGQFRDEHDRLMATLTRVSEALDTAESGSLDTEALRQDYAQARALFEAYRFTQAEGLLEQVIGPAENLEAFVQTVQFDWFNQANQTIQQVEAEGRTRDALILKGRLGNAQRAWEEKDYTTAKGMLLDIIAVSESMATVPILGLMTLPLLRLLKHPQRKRQ